jgi:hypothetical protein
MTLSESYRMKATDCRLRADIAQNDNRRSLFLHMEECWHALAARADTLADESTVADRNN